MTTRNSGLSAFMDGELDARESADVLRALRREPELRAAWSDYQLVGAALRRELAPDDDITARVMAALDEEPTVLAPKRSRPLELVRPLAALAASASGVAVVAWLALATGETAVTQPAAVAVRVGGGGLAQASLAVAPPPPQASPRMEEYLVAHRTYAAGGAMVGGARNLRTVALDHEGH